MIRIGDYVRALNQDSEGQVVELDGANLIIIDDRTDCEYPESRRAYTINQVEFL